MCFLLSHIQGLLRMLSKVWNQNLQNLVWNLFQIAIWVGLFIILTWFQKQILEPKKIFFLFNKFILLKKIFS